MKYQTIDLSELTSDEIASLAGAGNKNITILSELYDVELLLRGDKLKVFSEDEDLLRGLYEQIEIILEEIEKGNTPDYDLLKQTFRSLQKKDPSAFIHEVITYSHAGKPVKAKTYHQAQFIDLIRKNDLVFSTGPAGTGKTFIAILMAVAAYKKGDTKKIVLTRPAVEAGESLGFLPGDLKEKVDPYLMPLYDSLYFLMGKEQVEKLIEKGDIEIIPLAFMRGRTLNDSYIILDEAQNTTEAQMLMFLTRLGHDSKMIVNGDITQIDLNIRRSQSGLIAAISKLDGIDGISFIEFDGEDIVRHPLVQKIIERLSAEH